MCHLIAARNRPTASLTTASIEFWTPAALSSSAIHNRSGASLKAQTLCRPPAGFDPPPFTHPHPPAMQSRGPFPRAPSPQPNHVSIQHPAHSALAKEPHSWSLCPRSGCILALSPHNPRFREQIKPPGHQATDCARRATNTEWQAITTKDQEGYRTAAADPIP